MTDNWREQLVEKLIAKYPPNFTSERHQQPSVEYLTRTECLTREIINEAIDATLEKAVETCVDMAGRYDADIEGCDADELMRYGEGITCSFRLAYIIKYGKFLPKGDAWQVEFVEQLKKLGRSLAADDREGK